MENLRLLKAEVPKRDKVVDLRRTHGRRSVILEKMLRDKTKEEG